MENGILQPPWSSDVLGLRIEAQIDSTGAAPNKLSWSLHENSAKRRKDSRPGIHVRNSLAALQMTKVTTEMPSKVRRWWLMTPRREASPRVWSTRPSSKERKYIEELKVFEVVDRKMTERCKLVTTRLFLTNKGTVEKPDVQARWDPKNSSGWTA